MCMRSQEPTYAETSAHSGLLFVAFGVGTWLLHSLVGVFTGWGWAAAIGSLWVVVGALLLFGDVRVYQFGPAPLEELLVESDEP